MAGMTTARQVFPAIAVGDLRIGSVLMWCLVAAVAVAAGAGIADGGLHLALILGMSAIGSILIGAFVFEGRALLAWIVLAPLAYPFLRYPQAGQALTFDRAFVAILVGVVLLTAIRAVRSAESKRFFSVLVIFTIFFGLMAAFTSGATEPALSSWVSSLLVPLGAFFVARAYVTEGVGSRALLGSIALAGALVAIIGIAEAWRGFELASFSGSATTLDPNIGRIRVSGPYENSQVYGLVLALSFAAALGWLQLTTGRARLIGVPLLGTLLLGLYYGYTRSSWAAVVLIFLVWLLLNVDLRVIVRVALVVMAGLTIFVGGKLLTANDVAFNERLSNRDTVESRLATYQKGMLLVAEAPIFGVGIGQYTAASDRSIHSPTVGGDPAATSSHSTPLNVLVEQGIVGLAALLWVLVAAFALLRKSATSPRKELRVVAVTTVAATTGYVAVALTDSVLTYGSSNAMVMLLFGCTAGLMDRVHVGAASEST